MVLPQNEEGTIRRIADMVRETTAPPGGTPALAPSDRPSRESARMDLPWERDASSMPRGMHLVLVRQFMHRPLRLETLPYFADPAMAAKVRSRGRGPVTTEVMPAFVRAARVAEHRARQRDRPLDKSRGDAKRADVTAGR